MYYVLWKRYKIEISIISIRGSKGEFNKMITKDMIIGDVISEHPELVRTFFANGMMCIGCPASQGESIEAAAQVHGLDGDALTAALNEALGA